MEPTPETRQALDEVGRYGDTGLEAALLTLGSRAVSIVPECVGLSLSFVEDGVTFTLVATSDEVAVLDAVQYVDGGPCVTSLEEHNALVTEPGDPLDEERWLMFTSASAAAGVASTLSLPVLREGRVAVGINLYASTVDAFEGRREELAEALGASASDAVANADLGFITRERAAEAPARLQDNEDVEIAVGIIAASHGVDTSSARSRLESAAARSGLAPAEVARALKHLRTA